MAFQNFVDYVGPALSASWLNQVDRMTAGGATPSAFSAGDATPSVSSGGSFSTANVAPTNITTFDDGVNGQKLEILVTDANTTFVNGVTLKTNTGANVAASANRLYCFKMISGVWYMY